jgi:colanic acid/amylovoran biosynthesis protein
MKIFVSGQCTVHWGRLEYGNIGNYYITEAMFRELHRVFPSANIVTTFQMTDEFCERENIKCLPMEFFYSWSNDVLVKALNEFAIAKLYNSTGTIFTSTPFIDNLLDTDLFVVFSGELWGDHAEPVGENRFLIGLLKDRVAQMLGIKTVLLAGSQGPFSNKATLELAKEVFENFDAVLNREPASIELLKDYKFKIDKVQSFTDVAFLFDGYPDDMMQHIYEEEKLNNKEKPIVGYILCGFNMLEGPYDKWPRRDDEFTSFAESVEMIVSKLGARVVLLSHQNGFELPPNFKLINGRDFPYARGLYDVLRKRAKIDMNDVYLISKPYLPKETKAIIGKFDLLVTGRIHAFVAAVSQCVPSVIINRGNSPKSLRNLGFAKSVGFEQFLASPADKKELIELIEKCFRSRESLKIELSKNIPKVKEVAHELFDKLKNII